MAKKNFDPKAKAKRQKIFAAVGGVLLLGVLAFEIPNTMKQIKQSQGGGETTTAAAPATTTPAVPGSVPLAPPTLDGSAPVGGTSSPSTGSSAPVTKSELVGFNVFASKDPFQQQISKADLANAAAQDGSGSLSPSATGSSGSLPDTPTASTSTGGSGSSGGSTPSAPAAAPTAAVISVNGQPAQLVVPDQDFPLPPYDPAFHLVELTAKGAKIAIAGGSYASGAKTVLVTKTKPLTLVNTADGTRYEIKILWVGSGAPPAGLLPATSGSSGSSGSTGSAPTTTTTTSSSTP